MSQMPSLRDHERRITTLEDRVGEIKTNHGESLYKLHRFRVKTDLRFAKLFEHFNIEDVAEGEVDEVLDAE